MNPASRALLFLPPVQFRCDRQIDQQGIEIKSVLDVGDEFSYHDVGSYFL